MAVTLHYITKQFVLRKVTVGVIPFPGKHTGQNIATQLDNLVKSFESLKMVKKRVVVCDKASNIKTVLRKSETIADLESGSITCIDHKLNMALERTANKQHDIKAAIDACRTISARVHHSPLAEGVLKKKCLEMNGNIFNFLSRYEYEVLQLNVKFLQIFSNKVF